MRNIFSRQGGWKTIASGHRSGLEDRIAEQLHRANVKADYENYSLPYVIPESSHTYTPDFVLDNGIIVEAKGIFDANDRKKHLLIKDQYPHLDIRFVFSNAKAKIYKGSKTTLAEWCDKYGYKYATKEIPYSWFKEEPKDTSGLQRKRVKKSEV